MGNAVRMMIVLLAVVLLLAACGGQRTSEPLTSEITVSDDDGMHGAVLTEQYVVPDLSLTDTGGDPFSLREDTRRPLTLVFFGYTNCPDICQVVMADIASAMNRLDASERKQVGMVFVTTDPARDDEQALRTYLDRFDPGFEGLTGALPTIVEAGNAFGVPIEKGARMPSGGYEVVHGTQIVAIDGNDRSPIVWTEGTPADDLAEDISDLVGTGSLSP